MSGARKKSSFQITSITSEFEPPPAPPALEPPEDTAAPRNGPPGAASRFRLVKLDQGPGEPFKRGRWTCLEFYDHDPEHQAVGRLLGAPRYPQSLDSRLELAGLLPKPHGYFSPPPPLRGHGHSQGTAYPSEHLPHSLGGGERTPGGRAHSHGAAAEPSLGVEELLLPHSLAQRIRREMEERHKVPPRGSRPSSPAPPFFREGSPVRRGSDPFGGLARSMFAMGGHQDSDDESGSGSSMIAIDNKIEQAMASAPQDLGPPEAALLRDVSGLLRFIRAQLRQLTRTERGGAPLLPPRGPPPPRRLLAGLEIGLCSQSQDPQPMALLEGVLGGVTQPPRTTAHLSVRPPGVRE